MPQIGEALIIMFCKQCRKGAPDGSNFYPHCGAQNAISPGQSLSPVTRWRRCCPKSSWTTSAPPSRYPKTRFITGDGRCSKAICSTRGSFRMGAAPMARKRKPNDYCTGISLHEVEARMLRPEIQAFFESEEGQREFAEWKAQRDAGQKAQA